MQCTAEEIEQKRQLALRRLAERKQAEAPTKVPSPYQSKFFKSTESSGPLSSPKSCHERRNVSHPYNKPVTATAFQTKPVTPVTTSVQFYGKEKVISGELSLINSTRFTIKFSEYSQQAIEVMKTIPSRFFNPNKKNWDFHLDDYEEVQRKFKPLKPNITIDILPSYVLRVCRNKEPEVTYDLTAVDKELLEALMPFQEEGVCFGIDKGGRCMIADDMGLGKTFQALGVGCYYRNDWPMLIATTATMRTVWEETIYKFIPSIPIMNVQYMSSSKDFIDTSTVVIVSHDLMSRCLDKLMKKCFGVVILDESHVMKNFKTKCAKAASDLSKRAKRVILLSGTPALSRPSELYTQLGLIDGSFFGNFINYSKRYCDGRTTTFGWNASGCSNLQELEIILAKKFMIRRTKEDVLKSLPNKTQEVISLDVDLKQFSEADQKCLLSLAAQYNHVKKDKHAALLTFFAETSKIKIPSVCSYILQVIESKQKFLVFAHHQKMLDAIEQVLIKKKQKFIRIDGSTSIGQRKFFVDKFQHDENYKAAVLSITAANAGITLTAARLVLFAELHWNPSILSQAEARAHRIGQEGHVVIQYLIATGTADDTIWPMIQNKQKILKDIGLMGDAFRDVSIKKQDTHSCTDLALETTLTNGLNLTTANTLDISSYFHSSPSKRSQDKSGDIEDLLNDDQDDIFCNIQID